jgi:hypothetical protein
MLALVMDRLEGSVRFAAIPTELRQHGSLAACGAGKCDGDLSS